MVNILYLVLPLLAFLFLLLFFYYNARRTRLAGDGEYTGRSFPLAKIILAVLAIIIYGYIIMSYELMLWQQGVATLIAIIIVWVIWKKSISNQESQTPETSTTVTVILIIAYAVIFVIILYPILYFFSEQSITFCGNNWEKKVKILSAESWKNNTDSDGNCRLTGGGKIGFYTQIFSRIKIIPAERSPTDFEFTVGDSYKAGSKKTDISCRRIGSAKFGYYDPYFDYKNSGDTKNKTDNQCVEYYPNPQEITLSRSATGWERRLQLSIADNPLAEMSLGEGNHRPTTGNVTFYSSQISIAEIKIYCDERCWGERILNLW